GAGDTSSCFHASRYGSYGLNARYSLGSTMPAQRRIDLILESVRRLLRMGATPNLLNLLQKQHPADLAQIFAELPEKERASTFNILVDRNGKLAMEALSELGAEKGAELLALRPAEEIARLAQEVPSDDAAALID